MYTAFYIVHAINLENGGGLLYEYNIILACTVYVGDAGFVTIAQQNVSPLTVIPRDRRQNHEI